MIGILLGLLLGAAFTALAVITQKFPMNKGSTVTLIGPMETRTIVVEVARTPSERALGMMGRTFLPEDHGMLFLFTEDASPRNFWMKNTPIPLDILFFAADGSLVSTTSMVPCNADPCPLYPSGAPAAYALEVPAGFVARHGVGRGWRLTVPEDGW